MDKEKINIEGLSFDTGVSIKKETVGEVLKSKREALFFSLDDISNNLKIKKYYLEALEDNNFSALPGNAYVIGFLKSYSLYLGLNVNELIDLYKNSYCLDVDPALNISEENSVMKDPVLKTNHILFVLVFIFLAILLILLISKNKEKSSIAEISSDGNLEVSLPAVPSNSSVEVEQKLQLDTIDNSKNSNVSADKNLFVDVDSVVSNEKEKIVSDTLKQDIVNGIDIESVKTSDLIKTGKEYGLNNKLLSRIVLKATKPVWIKLKKDGFYKYDTNLGDIGTGVTIFEKLLNIGDVYYVPEGDNYYLTIGNAQGIDIFVDGKLVSPISKYEVARHNIEMNVEKLKSGSAYIKR